MVAPEDCSTVSQVMGAWSASLLLPGSHVWSEELASPHLAAGEAGWTPLLPVPLPSGPWGWAGAVGRVLVDRAAPVWSW